MDSPMIASLESCLERQRQRPRALTFALRHPVLVAGSFLLALMIALALFAPWIVPHDPTEMNVIQRLKPPSADLKQILKAVSVRDESSPPVIAKTHKPGKAKADPIRGLFEAKVDGKPAVVEYEPDPDLRDTEQVPLLEPGGIAAFIRREVLPYTPDAWIKDDATKIGYEISFTRHFYKPQPLRTLEEISADILAIEQEAEGLLDGLLKVGGNTT